MPAKRNYAREASLESPQRKESRRKRQRARYAVLKKLTKAHGATKAASLMQGKDVDHKRELSKGGSNSMSNLQLKDARENRKDKSMFKGSRTTRPKGGGRK